MFSRTSTSTRIKKRLKTNLVDATRWVVVFRDLKRINEDCSLYSVQNQIQRLIRADDNT